MYNLDDCCIFYRQDKRGMAYYIYYLRDDNIHNRIRRSLCSNTRIMQHRVINLRSEEEELIDYLRKIEKPYSLWVQRILPKATPEQYGYLFAGVYKAIGDYIGESPQEVHKLLMREFGIEFAPTFNPLIWELRIKSGSTWTTSSIGEWIDIVSGWAFSFLGVSVPEPDKWWRNQ